MLGLEIFDKNDKDGWESRQRKKLRANLQSVASSGPDVSMVSARFPDVNQLLYLFIPMTGFQCCQSPSSHSYVEGQEV